MLNLIEHLVYHSPISWIGGAFLVLYVVYRYFRGRLIGGSCEIAHSGHNLILKSGIGQFTFDRTQRACILQYHGKKKSATIPFKSIQWVVARKVDTEAQWEELLLHGFDWRSDYYRAYHFALVTEDGVEFPIYQVVQYRILDSRGGHGYGMIMYFLEHIGLYTKIEQYAHQLCRKLDFELKDFNIYFRDKTVPAFGAEVDGPEF